MKATLPGAALGGAGQLVSLGVQNISGNRLEKAGGMVLLGLLRGQLAGGVCGLKGGGDPIMDGLIRRERSGKREGMVRRQDQGVGQVLAMFNQAATGIATDKRDAGVHDRGLLKISDGDTGLFPAVDAENGCLDVAEQRLVDGHVFKGGGFAVENESSLHLIEWKIRMKKL